MRKMMRKHNIKIRIYLEYTLFHFSIFFADLGKRLFTWILTRPPRGQERNFARKFKRA